MLIQANAVHIPLPDRSVQTIATSPPYWAKRAYAGRQQAVVWPGVEFDAPGGAVRFPGDPHCAPPDMRWMVENGCRAPQHAWGDELKAGRKERGWFGSVPDDFTERVKKGQRMKRSERKRKPFDRGASSPSSSGRRGPGGGPL